MSWDRLLGQGVAKRILQSQLHTDQLSHAYLFTGPTGAEKELAALLLAQAVNCAGDVRPCDSCTSCRQIELGVHSDVRRIKPDGSSIKLNQIRSLLAEAVLTPNIGPYRVFIIEGAELLTREAANALLLILEEPPHFDLFILTASAPVLPTIESRCQLLRFQPATLPQNMSEGESLHRARALQLLTDISQSSLTERGKLVDELEKAEVDLSGLLAELLQLYRDFTVWQVTQDPNLIVDKEAVELFYPVVVKQRNDLLAASQAILDVQRRIQNNVNKRLALEYLLYNL